MLLNTNHPTANLDTLLSQAPETVKLYVREALEILAHHDLPRTDVLIAALVDAMTKDLHTAILSKAIGSNLELIAAELGRIADSQNQ